MSLLIELALSTALVTATAVFHGLGLLAIGRALRALDRGRADVELSPLSVTGADYTSTVVLGLLAGQAAPACIDDLAAPS